MTDSIKNLVESSNKGRLTRHEDTDVLRRIYDALPAAQRERFQNYRQQWQEVDQQRLDLEFPLNIYIEPVSGCNLRCVFCIRSRREWQENANILFSGAHLGLEQFKQIVDEGMQYGLPAIWVGASGEALLEKNICDMMLYAHEQGIIDNILITNGNLLTKDTIDRLLDIPITRLNISIDAFTEETYRKVRGGNYKKLMENIHYLLARRGEKQQTLPVVRVTFVDMELNRHEKEAFVAYWKDRVDTVDVQKHYDFDLTAAPPDRDRNVRCSFPWRSIMILANGDVLPCCSFYAARELVMGNIAHLSIKSIWDSEQFRTFRHNMKNGILTNACKMCFDSIYG